MAIKPLNSALLVTFSEQQIDSMPVAEVRSALNQHLHGARRLYDPQKAEREKREFDLLMDRAKFLAGRTTRADSFVCGWPAHMLTATVVANSSVMVEVEGGLQVSSRGTKFALPTTPLWPGFAINTVFYAVVLWLLFAGPFVLRRQRRIRRGLCPKCAYDLRGTRGGPDATACPECGAAQPT